MTSVLAYGQPAPPPPPPPPALLQQPQQQPSASMATAQFLSSSSSSHSGSQLRPLPAHLGGGATCPVGHPLDPCQPTCSSCQAITGAIVRGQQQSLGLGDGSPPSAFYARTESAISSSAAKAEMLRNMAVGPYPTYSTLDPYTVYPYLSSYAGIDARRKNSMKEATNTLKAWLFEHRKNPYPTKGEKIMLAILTKMTLTQVSTWFANARRRLKKENKVTWGSDKEEDDDDDDDVDSGMKNVVMMEDDIMKEDGGEDEDNKEHYEDEVREEDGDDDDDDDDEIDIGEEACHLAPAPTGRPGQLEVAEVNGDRGHSGRNQDAKDAGPQGVVCLKPEGVRKTTYGAEGTGDKSCQQLTGEHRNGVMTSGQHSPSHGRHLDHRQQLDSGHYNAARGNGPIANNGGGEGRQQTNTQKPKIWSIADMMGFRDSESTPGESSRSPSSSSDDHAQGVLVSRNGEGRPGPVAHPHPHPHAHPHYSAPTASTSGVMQRSSDSKLYPLGDAQYAAQLLGGVPLNGTAPYPAIYSQYLQTGISMDGVYPSFLPGAYWRTS